MFKFCPIFLILFDFGPLSALPLRVYFTSYFTYLTLDFNCLWSLRSCTSVFLSSIPTKLILKLYDKMENLLTTKASLNNSIIVFCDFVRSIYPIIFFFN